VSPSAELHILASKRGHLAVAQSRLGGNEQEHPVAPADPCAGVGSCHKGFDLFLREKLNRTSLVALCRDGKEALAVQGKGRFTEGHVLEEGLEGGEAIVSCPGAVASFIFKVIEELFEEGDVEVLQTEFRRLASEVLCGEAQ